VIFVSFDVDAICSFKILQHMLKYDEILFTMMPVQGLSDLKKEFDETPNEVTGKKQIRNIFVLKSVFL
jgi:cell division control protein 45